MATVVPLFALLRATLSHLVRMKNDEDRSLTGCCPLTRLDAETKQKISAQDSPKSNPPGAGGRRRRRPVWFFNIFKCQNNGKKIGRGCKVEIVLKSAEAPAFLSLVCCVGVLGG